MDRDQVDSAPPAAVRPTRPRAGKNALAAATSGIANRPGLALAAIVVLVVVVIYLFLQTKGILGKGGPSKKKKPRAAKKAAASADEDDDPEVDDLIAQINEEE